MHTSITITRARITRTLFAGLLTAAALLGLASAAEALNAPRPN